VTRRVIIAVVLAGCTQDVDPVWQLDLLIAA
jgi:hypothetical protein